MKSKLLITGCVLCAIFLTVLYAKATQSTKESNMVKQIINNGDTPKQIKTMIARMKEKLDVDEDNFPSLINEMETYANQVTDIPSVAVLHSMVAEMYNRYYQQNRWIIDRRTAIEGYIPDDIREWPSNLFTKKIKNELDASLEHAAILQQTLASQFKEIMTVGKDSPTLRPTLYEFLAYRALDIQPSDEIYKDLLSYRQSLPDKKNALITQLEYLEYNYRDQYSSIKESQYEASLDSLLTVYEDKDYSVEIVSAKLNLMRNKSYRTEYADSIRHYEYKLATETIARYPQYERIDLIRNWLASMEEPRLQVQSDNTVYPGKSLELKLNYTNVSTINVKVYQSLKSAVEVSSYHYDPATQNKNTKGKLVKDVSFRLNSLNTYTGNDTTVSIPMEANGLYEYEITSPGNQTLKAKNVFSVSRVASVFRSGGAQQAEVLVTDYQTGKPIQGTKVNYYIRQKGKLQLTGSANTDKDGLARLPDNKDIIAYQTTHQDDASSFITSIYISSNISGENNTRTAITLFTDRNIYRPGQTVFFKGIAYNNDKDNPQTVSGKRVEVILRDANYQEVTTKSFTTNQFGSFNGEFTLPRQTLTGIFTITTENGSANIQVEEYKRPTFKIDIDPVKEDIAYGDNVTIKGKAQTFSGVSLQEGEITYRIIRRPYWFRIYYGNFNEEQVAEGKTTVGTDGTFSFSFRPEKSEQTFPLSFQTYEVYTSLTDSKGETQEAISSFSVGERSVILYTNLGNELNKDSADVNIMARTLNGEEFATEGTYSICVLKEGEEGKPFIEGETLAKGVFQTGKPLAKEVFAKLPSGRLRICISAKDSKGRTITEEQDFVLYSKKDKRPPVFMHTWMLTENISYLPGEKAEIIFGTSDKDAYILYELFSNGMNVSRERIVLNNENRIFSIPFKEIYGDGVVASFTFIKEGKLYTKQTTINRKRPDRSLTIKPETFRDHLLPGSKETWKFRITDADSIPVLAEVLAGMYDASLDKIRPFAWSFSPISYSYPYYSAFSASEGLRSQSYYTSEPAKMKDVPQYAFDRVNWQGVMDFNRYRSTRAYAGGALMKQSSASVMVESIEDHAAVVTNDAMPAMSLAQQTNGEMEEGASFQDTPSTPHIRTNFNETAFFFPALSTDKDGNIVLNFTIPESNTTWKLQALAHTSDLKYGLLTKEVITQKPLMVLPNLPRFMRKGDVLSISTQIMNLSDQEVSGTARIELFDPENEQPVVCLTKNQRSFTLPKSGTTTVSWLITVPDAVELIGCRIIADSESASDGEQHLIPILSNEILITESTPFYLMEEGKKTIRLGGDNNSSTRRQYNTTFELSSNPVWYAVQALPTVTLPENDNIISWFASYYSNTLAVSIAQSNPKIKKIIDQWTAQGGNASTLLSSLEKNEELKNVLLEETPWVLEAKTETEQKQRLSLLFDVNRATQQRDAALQVLLQQQTDQGGWGWFKGFYPSRSITLSILNGMSQLVRLSSVQYNQEEKEMQMKALNYLDKTMQKDYEALKSSKTKLNQYTPSEEQLNYLYVRSYYRDIPEWGEAREGIRFFTNQAEKNWEKASLYGKGEIALLMHRNGKKEVAQNILAWLRKTATTTEDKGMYWANNKRGNSYFISPIDVHCLLMTAFQELGTNQTETDRMKQWLLNQKRTQNWESVPTTVNAIYSILSTGSDWLNDNNHITVKWGDKILNSAKGETATGYIKESVTGKDLTSDMQMITVDKEGKAPAWGAVYDQYFESIEKVNQQKGALNVEKKLFIETNSGTQRQIIPVTQDRPLHIGDKVIVRLTIRTDRDMEYVSLKDLRAGCFEPNNQLSGSMFADGIRYYRSPKDVSENFYFDYLPTGTHVLEYAAHVSRSGQFSGGITTIQCMYAPEFVSHTEGNRILVQD